MTWRTPSCSRSRSSSCCRCCSSARSWRRCCRRCSAAWRSCHVLRAADRLELRRPVGVRAELRHRARTRAGDRLQPVHGLPLPRGGRQVRIRRQALRRTLQTAGRTIMFSSLTVAAAIASLAIFPQRFLYSMGIAGALVALLAATLALLVLPALLAVLGPRVNALAPKRLQRAADRDARPGAERRLVPPVAVRDAAAGPDRGRQRRAADRARDPVLRHQVHHRQRARPAPRRERAAGRRRAQPASSRRTGPRRSRSSSAHRRPRRRCERSRAESSSSPTSPRSPAAARRRRRPRWSSVAPGQRAAERRHPAARPRRPGARSSRSTSASPARRPRTSTSSTASRRTCRSCSRSSICSTLIILFLMTGSVVLPVKAVLMNVLEPERRVRDPRADLPGRQPPGAARLPRARARSTRPSRSSCARSAFGLATDYGVFLLSRIKEARDAGASDSEAVAIGLERTADRHRRGDAVRGRDRRVRDLQARVHQGARDRRRAGGADRRVDRPRAARAVADGAARRVELVGAGAAAAPARADRAARGRGPAPDPGVRPRA